MPQQGQERDARPTRHLLVASHARRLRDVREQVRLLRRAGHTVRWAFLLGTAPEEGRGADRPHRLQPRLKGARGSAVRAALRVSPGPARLWLRARHDRWLLDAGQQVEEAISLDPAADAVLRVVSGRHPGVTLVPAADADAHLARLTARERLRLALDADDPDEWTAATLAVAPEDPDLGPDPFRRAVDSLARRTPDRVPEAVAAFTRLPGLADDPLLLARRAVAELDRDGRTAVDPSVTSAAVLKEVDDLVDDPGRRDLVVDRIVLALSLAFHRELHSDVPSTPLVEDPEAYLAPLRATRSWALLTGTPPADRPRPPRKPADTARTTVALLPGAYGRFAAPIADALREVQGVRVRVLDLPARWRHFGSMGVSPPVVQARVQAALGEPVGLADTVVGEVAAADVVLADWADKGAVWASLMTPPGTPLVVRVHSVDALRPWLHLVDWSRVDTLVCVSPHVLDLVHDLLGPALEGVQTRVVPNLVDLDRLAPSGDTEEPTRPDAPLVLGMVGWAQRVKDPLWALELLARLRAGGHDCQLVLVGADFADPAPASGRACAEEFRARLLRDDVREHVRFTGHLRDLRPVLAGVDVALSTSVRESNPVGLMESVAAGAVPVVRDWPQARSRGGARRQLPEAWVVDSVEQAVERVAALTDPVLRATEAHRAREWLARAMSPRSVAAAYRAVVLGEAGVLHDLLVDHRDEEASAAVEEVLADPASSAAALRAAASAAFTLGELTVGLRAQERLAELDPDRWQPLVRGRLGRVRELSPWWTPQVADRDPGEPVPGRVLHVLKQSLPYRQSGYSVRSSYLMAAQQRAGRDVVAVTALDFPPADALSEGAAVPVEEVVGGVRHRRLRREGPPGGPFDRYLQAYAEALADVVLQERPEVVHVHSGHRGYEGAVVALAVGRALRVPVVYEVRGLFEAVWTTDETRAEQGETYRSRRALEERCMHAAGAVVTLSGSMRGDLVGRGIDPDRVFVVPNGVDPEAIAPRPRSADLAARLGLEGRFVFGYVSNLDHPREAQELLVDAAVALRDRGLDAVALIVGDGARRADIEEHVARQDAADVVVLTGAVPHGQVADYYAQLDVFVVPRVDERAARLVTPLKPYEAMALGVPVVVSDLPALLEMVGEGRRGEVFPAGDPAALTEVLAALARDPGRRAALAATAREWVVRERSWDANARAYEQAYAAAAGRVPDWPAACGQEASAARETLVARVRELQRRLAGVCPDDPLASAVPEPDDAGLRWQARELRSRLSAR